MFSMDHFMLLIRKLKITINNNFCNLIFFLLPENDVNLLPTQSQHLLTLGKKAFENTVGKGENAGNLGPYSSTVL